MNTSRFSAGSTSAAAVTELAGSCPPSNKFGEAKNWCSILDPRTKCVALPSVFSAFPDVAQASKQLSWLSAGGRSRTINPLDFAYAGPVYQFRETLNTLAAIGAYVYDGDGFRGTVVGSEIQITIPALQVVGGFLGYAISLTGELRAASANMVSIENESTVAILDGLPTVRYQGFALDILARETFFVPTAVKQVYNQIGRPVISRLAVEDGVPQDDTIHIRGLSVPANVTAIAWPITPEMWAFDEYSLAIEGWAHFIATAHDPNNT